MTRILVFLIVLVVPAISNADTIDVQIKGIDDGIKTSKQQDYKEAVLFAKREAIERAGVKVKSMTTVKDMMLESDYIETQAEAVLMPGYNIIDMGYAADGTYQIVLIGQVYSRKRKDESKEVKVTTSSGDLPYRITNSLGMKFVYIKPGSFVMGSPISEYGRNSDEKQHRVTLSKGFYMQVTEVTQGQWKAIMGNNPSYFSNCGEDCPVEQVSWDNVQEFILNLNLEEMGIRYRLPTEAEWEYAARAGSTAGYCFGSSDAYLHDYAWYKVNSGNKTHRVAQKKPNVWGLYDIHGNVYEWCQDRYKNKYPSGSVTDPKGPTHGSARVNRGGGYFNDAKRCRLANRYWDRTDQKRMNYLGFRLVREP